MSSVYQIVTDKIIERLRAGTVPWHRPWHGPRAVGCPRNLISGREYRGMNVFLLSLAGYSAPWWLTYKQAAQKGGNVKKGERSSLVTYWKIRDVEKADPDTGKIRKEKIFSLFYHSVFNIEQCEGIEAPSGSVVDAPKDNDAIEICESIARGYANAPSVAFGGDRAYYMPSADAVRLPERGSFDSSEHFYSVLYHEFGHSTGHASRLARKGITDPIMFGSHAYSREELVAEMSAAFLCGESGISATFDSSASYIQSWLDVLKGDEKMVVHAASQAQKAADWILGRKPAASEYGEVSNA